MPYINNFSIEYYTQMIRAGEHFSFARFGDGEWKAALGYDGANCDGHTYFKTMGAELLHIIIHKYPDNRLYFGMQPLAQRIMGEEIDELVADLSIFWHSTEVFNKALVKHQLKDLIKALCDKKVLLVGPLHLQHFNLKFLTTAGHIIIPDKDCYMDKARIKNDILEYGADADIIAFSASMLTNILIAELFANPIGITQTMIDFGSIWDPFAGVQSRQFHKEITSSQLVEQLHDI